jgi:hypothetical protein
MAAVVFNPSRAVSHHECSVKIGSIVEHSAKWYELGTPVPEGTFAILRADAQHVELVADLVASRTLWYALTSEQFVASTSQRAVITLLGSFEPNSDVIPWMLSTGTLGPSGGWDARVHRVLPGECVTLDRRRWCLDAKVAAPSYRRETGVGRDEHAQRVAETLDDVGRVLDFEPSRWVLPLTGGTDSRGLLTALLRAGRDVRTITWGLSSARRRLYDDAVIARKVAEKFNVSNRYFPVNLSKEPREKLLDRFLVAGEGCVEAIPPFVDGFETWKVLHEEGIEGIVRGDQVFGCTFVHTEHAARYCTSLTLLSDLVSPEELASFELSEQRIPRRLQRCEGETLEGWRDRLYEQNRVSTFLAGLTRLESTYVEVVNPLLFARVLECARRLPDDLRTGKRLWRQVVYSRCSGVPVARRPAVLPLREFVNDTETLEVLIGELELSHDADFLSGPLRRRLLRDLQGMLRTKSVRRPRDRARQVVTHMIPFSIRAAIRRYAPAKPVSHPTALAFRAYIVSRMRRLLAADATALAAASPRTVTL